MYLLWRNVYFLIVFAFLIQLNEIFVVLEVNLLSVTSFANISSHYVGCIFILLMVSFAVQNFLNLIRSHLFIFVFIFITVRCGSKKIFLGFMPKSVLPMFSSKILLDPVLHQSISLFLCMVLENVLISSFHI